MIKAVLDTNQFVSSVISKKGISSKLLDAWRKHYFILITSKGIINEITNTLNYPRIKNKYKITDQNINELKSLIEHEAIILNDQLKVDVIKDDPDDNKVLACAIESDSEYIVSGDKHLLNVKQYKNIKIVTVQQFLQIINYKSTS